MHWAVGGGQGGPRRAAGKSSPRSCPLSPGRGLAPALLAPGFLGRPPRGGPDQGWGARGAGARIPCPPPHPAICSAPWRPEAPHPRRLVPGSRMAAGPLSWDLSPRMTLPFWVLYRGRSRARGRSAGLGLRSPALCDLGQVPSPLWASLFPLCRMMGLNSNWGPGSARRERVMVKRGGPLNSDCPREIWAPRTCLLAS